MKTSGKSDRKLTDLEALVLAWVHRRQPCTPYQIRRACEMSTTTKFSGSAGSIYPLVRRLVEQGYMRLVKGEADGRGSRMYGVTDKGLHKVRGWLTSLEDPAEIGMYDPIRSRLVNLSLLPKKEQIRWLRSAISLVERQKSLIQDYEAQGFIGDQRLFEISTGGMWAENATRLRWLRKALAVISEKRQAE